MKKTSAKKQIATKTIVKKPVAKKSPVKKSAAKIAPAKKPVAEKPVSKKPVAKKPVSKKPVSKKPVVRKAATKKLPAKTVATKPSPVKAVAKKTITKTAERKLARATKAAKAPKTATIKTAFAEPVWSDLVTNVLKTLDTAKAEQVVAVDLAGKSTIADTMVVASGRSSRHVNAIADQVVEELKKHGQKNIRIEGVPQCDWVLVDAGDIIVHVFRPEVRSFYNLEKLWSANIQPET